MKQGNDEEQLVWLKQSKKGKVVNGFSIDFLEKKDSTWVVGDRRWQLRPVVIERGCLGLIVDEKEERKRTRTEVVGLPFLSRFFDEQE